MVVVGSICSYVVFYLCGHSYHILTSLHCSDCCNFHYSYNCHHSIKSQVEVYFTNCNELGHETEDRCPLQPQRAGTSRKKCSIVNNCVLYISFS